MTSPIDPPVDKCQQPIINDENTLKLAASRERGSPLSSGEAWKRVVSGHMPGREGKEQI